MTPIPAPPPDEFTPPTRLDAVAAILAAGIARACLEHPDRPGGGLEPEACPGPDHGVDRDRLESETVP
ncbi:MAG: hypothetical protein K2Q20_01975 [Phycisphaerales bacterium]|nr:hypothetical protein [Phycisphaerales bacterium]